MSDGETLELQNELLELQEEIQLEYVLSEPTKFERNHRVRRAKKFRRVRRDRNNYSIKLKCGDPTFIMKHRTCKEKKFRFKYIFHLSTGRELKKIMRPKIVPIDFLYACSFCPKVVLLYNKALNDHVLKCTLKNNATLLRIPLKKVIRREHDGTETVIKENLNALNVQEEMISIKIGDVSNTIELTPVEDVALDIKDVIEIHEHSVKMEQESISDVHPEIEEEIDESLVKIEHECERKVALEMKKDNRLQGLVIVKQENINYVPLEIKEEIETDQIDN